MPSSLNCPTCGAAAAGPDASCCEYCGSTLTSIACPACFGAMFAGMQFCPHCGAKGTRSIDETATLVCPGCKGGMRRALIGTTSLFECSACASTWLDTDTFTQLCVNREERGAIAAMVGASGAEPTASVGGAVRYRPCPMCKKIMNRENFGRRSGVIIDVCKGHGVWFEARELQSVMAFINRGGLERARAHQAQLLKEQGLDGKRREQAPQERGAGEVRIRTATVDGASPSMAESLLREALNMLFS